MKKGILVIDLKKVALVLLAIVMIAVSLVPVGAAVWQRDTLGYFWLGQYADSKAGEAIRFEPEYYYDSAWIDWGLVHNSKWLLDWTLKIVPQLALEKVGSNMGMYPISVGFIPEMGERSFLNGGFTEMYWLAVWINDRYVLDETWNDEREVLQVLIHELIHIQGGNYVKDIAINFEPRTQAATYEVLAAMCSEKVELACKTFWNETAYYARANMRNSLNKKGLGFLYPVIANLFWRDAGDERAAAKWDRYWSENKDDRERILQAYTIRPWKLIVDGVTNGTLLDTGIISLSTSDTNFMFIQGMPFDDSKAMLGLWGWLLKGIK